MRYLCVAIGGEPPQPSDRESNVPATCIVGDASTSRLDRQLGGLPNYSQCREVRERQCYSIEFKIHKVTVPSKFSRCAQTGLELSELVVAFRGSLLSRYERGTYAGLARLFILGSWNISRQVSRATSLPTRSTDCQLLPSFLRPFLAAVATTLLLFTELLWLIELRTRL